MVGRRSSGKAGWSAGAVAEGFGEVRSFPFYVPEHDWRAGLQPLRLMKDSDPRGDVMPDLLTESAPERIREAEQFRPAELDAENGFETPE